MENEWEKMEKILAWQLTKVRNKKEVIDEARNEGGKVQKASLMDVCHSRIPSWSHNFKSTEAEDDSGSYAVFAEQGSSASQMTAAKIIDIISRLPGCTGQAADAVSACTRIKMEDAPKFLQIPKSECPDILDVHQSTNGRNHGPVWKTRLFLLNGTCTVILWQDYCGKGNLRKFC